ncbi:hypothetical protein N9M74_00095 [Pontimonas sp.]|nr:hypothetical protein [Pontimonas sp.]
MPNSSNNGPGHNEHSEPDHHVACAVDSQMSYALSVLLSSLKKTSSAPFCLTIGYLEGTLDRNDCLYLEQVCDNLTIRMNFLPLESKDSFISQGHISPTTFAKFLLADAIEGPHLWIDADTIALPGWDSIFSTILSASEEEGLVVASRGTTSISGGSRPSDLPFNAGVLGFPAGARRDWETPLASLEMVDTQEQFLFNQLYAETAIRVSENFNQLTYRIESLVSTNMPFIIHFAGAHKPWHLRRNLTKSCMAFECPWSAWFEAEQNLYAQFRNTPLLPELERRQRVALKAGKLRLRRDHSGYNFLRLLTALGPLSPFVLNFLGLLKQWIPRGTHPIH